MEKLTKRLIRVLLASFVIGVPAISAQSITVDGSLPANTRPVFQAVATDIYAIVMSMFRNRPPLDFPVTIYRSNIDFPITSLNNYRSPSLILIGVTADAQVDQFAFQFAHEMGHAMLNPRRNNGFVDAVCTALQLEVLNRLSVKWRTSPPAGIPALLGYDVASYGRRYASEIAMTLPREMRAALANGDWAAVRTYLKLHRGEIEPSADPGYRTTQLIAALSILSKPVDWPVLLNIAACTDPDTNREPDFRTLPLAARCLSSVQEVQCRIGAACE